MFYSGFLAYSVCHLPLTAPEIATELKKPELPYYRAALCAIVTKTLFAILGCQLLLAGKHSLNEYALAGAGLYTFFHIVPGIVNLHGKVQMIIYYRGKFTSIASFIISTLLPWAVSAIAPRYDSVVILACLFGSTLAMIISYVNSIWFYCCTVYEAGKFENNF